MMQRWRVGEVEITRVLEHEKPFVEIGSLLPDLTPEILERHRQWMEPDLLQPGTGWVVIAFHSFLIRTPQSLILVDTCSGNDKPRPHKTKFNRNHWPYLENLAAAGARPDDIDFVMCTHLHVDHVGWNTRLIDGLWVPTFPHAHYLFARQEWEYWRVDALREKYTPDRYDLDSILPVIETGQADFVGLDHVIDDWVRIEPSTGHTPGHVNVRVRSGEASAVMCGDICHTALQVAEPDINSCFCIEPEKSRRTRHEFLAQHADTPVLVMPSHFPTPTAGWVRKHGPTYRFQFDFASLTGK
jgi:glyoxylase-like metal-dependent hydrolase (beta-lactamase superfamily II)